MALLNIQSHQTNRMPYSQYLSNLSPEKQRIIMRVANTVGCILTVDNQVNGSALVIHRNFILVSKHCFPFERGEIYFEPLKHYVQATTFLDGENDALQQQRSDFKILYIQEDGLTPAPLSVQSAIGEGVQINYHIDRLLYVRIYESLESEGGLATRSDLGDVVTVNGDSGGARYSWSCRGVASIHQGQSEALTINQIYHVVHTISNYGATPDLKNRALTVLRALDENIVDPTMLKMHSSPVYLKPGQVIPERHGLFQYEIISTAKIKQFPKATATAILDYLDKFNDKDDFFAKIPGLSGTIYRIYDHKNKLVARIDRQDPMVNASNIQIQVDGYTVATVLVNNELYEKSHATADRRAAVINYINYHFWMSIRDAESTKMPSVKFISLRQDVFF